MFTIESSVTCTQTPWFTLAPWELLPTARVTAITHYLNQPETQGLLAEGEAQCAYPQAARQKFHQLGLPAFLLDPTIESAGDAASSAGTVATFPHIAALIILCTAANASLGVTVGVNLLALLPIYIAGDAQQLGWVALLAKLRTLQAAYPQVIRQVRGRGLMIGIELIPQLDSHSNLLRVASEQKLLGFLISGYPSIITNNCQALVEDQVGLTSGNSLTAAAAIAATQQAAGELGIAWSAAALGIVGGVGNIGRVISEMEAARVGSLLLCGRAGTEARLQRLADTLIATGANPVGVSSDLAALHQCNVIITASNAPEPLITPAHLNAHPTVICDVATTVRQARPQVRVIKGGIMQLPGNQEITIRGMALAQDDAYACIAEVILLGLAGVRHHFSYGALHAERVQQIGALARQYGFTVRVREGE